MQDNNLQQDIPELVKTEALTYMDEPTTLLISGYAFSSSAMVRVAIPPSSCNQSGAEVCQTVTEGTVAWVPYPKHSKKKNHSTALPYLSSFNDYHLIFTHSVIFSQNFIRVRVQKISSTRRSRTLDVRHERNTGLDFLVQLLFIMPWTESLNLTHVVYLFHEWESHFVSISLDSEHDVCDTFHFLAVHISEKRLYSAVMISTG